MDTTHYEGESVGTAVAVRERPILFSGEMVRAILDGRKTQTRRVVKLPVGRDPFPCHWVPSGWALASPANEYGVVGCSCEEIANPYGQPGDRLWVRETWQYADWTEDGMPWVRYKADGAVLLHENTPEEWGERLLDAWADLSDPQNYGIDDTAADRRWRPSIHMPRWASRITLEITDVRVERVQEISEEDARAEGVSVLPLQSADDPSAWWQTAPGENQSRTARGSFAMLWEKLNGPRGYGWDANPWVWVVSFARVEPAA